jgi:hypothetical protein
MLMLEVLGAALLVAVIAALLTRGTVAAMGRLGGESIHRLLSGAEYIVEHHAVPPAWRDELSKKLGGLRPGCDDGPRRARDEARAKRACLRELARLITFARKSSVVADEEARDILVAELVSTAVEWESASWDMMCCPPAPPNQTP